MNNARVGIVMGSKSDWAAIEPAAQTLRQFGVGCDVRVLSAHRSPAQVAEYVANAPKHGIKIFIAAAGGAAHLAGTIAANTTLPVIGIPVESKSLKGLDSLLATVQMPGGVPVATVAINGSLNAALLAVQILALSDPSLAKQLADYKRELTAKTLEADAELQGKLDAVIAR
jgi:5-(carboxyamino)imidazole ribonucleotide mutase